MTDIQIASTTQAQLSAVLDQARATFDTHRARAPKAFPEAVLLKLEERHRDAVDLAGDTPTSFCAQAGDKTLGFVLLQPVQRAGMIYDIGVFPSARRQGVGSALLAHAIRVAKAREWTMLYATVWDGNFASHRLFQSAGFHAQQPILGRLAAFFPTKKRVTVYRCTPAKMTGPQ